MLDLVQERRGYRTHENKIAEPQQRAQKQRGGALIDRAQAQ
jgi:hypothetical protein